MRKINFGTPVVDPPRPVRSIQHWTESMEVPDRHLNMVPIVPGINGQHAYMITSTHWLDLLKSKPENRLAFPENIVNEHAVLAYGTTHEAALAAFRLLQGDL